MSTENDAEWLNELVTKDVTTAMEAVKNDSSPYSRRTAIRTIFSTVEALLWHARSRALAYAEQFPAQFDPSELMALREEAPSVDKRGHVTTRPAFVSLETNAKLTARALEKYGTPPEAFGFSSPKWEALTKAVEVRHRLTHPKSAGDLATSDADVSDAFDAFAWTLAFVLRANGVLIEALKSETQRMRGLVQAATRRASNQGDAN